MNIYYNIDDLNLSDKPVIVNMIIEWANGQQIVSSLAPAEVEKLKAELEECKRVRDKHYHHLKSAREASTSFLEDRDMMGLEVLRLKLEAAEKALRGES